MAHCAPLASLPWKQTSSDGLTTLTVASDHSYTLSFADSPPLTGAPPHGVTAVSTRSGVDDALGAFDGLDLATTNGTLSVLFYHGSDAFVFQRRPVSPAAHLQTAFPNFKFDHAALNASVQCIGWANRYFFPGGLASSLERCETDGPMVLVSRGQRICHVCLLMYKHLW